MTSGRKKGRHGAGSAAYAMQRRDRDGSLFCWRSTETGHSHAQGSREGLLVCSEQKSMDERKDLRECVDAVNAERRQLDQERHRLVQVCAAALCTHTYGTRVALRIFSGCLTRLMLLLSVVNFPGLVPKRNQIL